MHNTHTLYLPESVVSKRCFFSDSTTLIAWEPPCSVLISMIEGTLLSRRRLVIPNKTHLPRDGGHYIEPRLVNMDGTEPKWSAELEVALFHSMHGHKPVGKFINFVILPTAQTHNSERSEVPTRVLGLHFNFKNVALCHQSTAGEPIVLHQICSQLASVQSPAMLHLDLLCIKYCTPLSPAVPLWPTLISLSLVVDNWPTTWICQTDNLAKIGLIHCVEHGLHVALFLHANPTLPGTGNWKDKGS